MRAREALRHCAAARYRPINVAQRSDGVVVGHPVSERRIQRRHLHQRATQPPRPLQRHNLEASAAISMVLRKNDRRGKPHASRTANMRHDKPHKGTPAPADRAIRRSCPSEAMGKVRLKERRVALLCAGHTLWLR